LFSIFDWLPNAALGLLVIVLVVLLLLVWRAISPPAPGVDLGHFDIIGTYAGGKFHTHLRGDLVESTRLFMRPETAEDFKSALIRSVEMVKKNRTAQEETDLKTLKDQLGNEADIFKYARIYVTREGLLTKHVLIQWFYLGPLSEYASKEERSKFSLSTIGFKSEGVIRGEMTTFPTAWEVERLGKCIVHLFKPDPLDKSEKGEDPPKYLAQFLHTRTLIETEDLLKTKDTQLQEKERVADELRKENGGLTTYRDGAGKAMSAFSPEGEPPENLFPKRLDILDGVAVLVPTLVGYCVSLQAGVEPIAGVLVGALLGLVFIYRRQ